MLEAEVQSVDRHLFGGNEQSARGLKHELRCNAMYEPKNPERALKCRPKPVVVANAWTEPLGMVWCALSYPSIRRRR